MKVKTTMLSILKSRVILVTALFGVFGGALSLLLKIDEMQRYYVALSMLVAFLISLLLSFLLKGSLKGRMKQTLKIILSVGFVLFIVSALYHTKIFLEKTMAYHYPAGSRTSYLVKANNYSEDGKKRKALNAAMTDEELLYQQLGGPGGKRHLWDSGEIDSNTFSLITSYIILIIFFSGSVFALLEILSLTNASNLARTDGL
ncbi:MAG: hypothetical protein EKK37_05345 [Sphingobacteriales bacterium]|nr:MAG: hypothetical protein EKK37_05345 [Sphingobacteriales bacterium]